LKSREPEEVWIRKTLPAIVERLNALHQALARDISEWDVKTKERLDSIDAKLEDLFEGRVSMILAFYAAATGTAATIMATATATDTASAPAATRSHARFDVVLSFRVHVSRSDRGWFVFGGTSVPIISFF
jgi:hypothetical protein